MAEPDDEPAPELLGGPAGSGLVCCRVELFGLARSIVGKRALALQLPKGATVSDALARLLADYPALAGRVIRADGRGMTEGHILNLNGKAFVDDVATAVRSDDTLLILANTAGG